MSRFQRQELKPWAQLLLFILASLLLVLGVTISWLGAPILALGGDGYFLLPGLMLSAAALATRDLRRRLEIM